MKPRLVAAAIVIVLFQWLGCASTSLAQTSKPTAPAPGRHWLPKGAIQLTDIRYGDAPGIDNLLDIYKPEKVTAKLPLVVWIHGGGWAQGDKSPCPALPLLGRGFIVASINYRLTGAAPYPAQIMDCKGAIRFLRAHSDEYGIDPDRIGVWGASAGGHLVSLLGTSAEAKELEGTVGGNLDVSSAVQAVVDWFGPTDLSQIAAEARTGGLVDMRIGPPLIMGLLGGPMASHLDLVRQANPISYITPEHAAKIPPFLIMHGDQDNIVPLAQSQLLYDALKDAKVPVKFETIKGAGHGSGFNRLDVAMTMFQFFDKHLKG